jgi:hypothetical protein
MRPHVSSSVQPGSDSAVDLFTKLSDMAMVGRIQSQLGFSTLGISSQLEEFQVCWMLIDQLKTLCCKLCQA